MKRTNSKNITSECEYSSARWGKPNSTGCLARSMLASLDSGVYWCESSKGKSNSVNITVTGRFVSSLSVRVITVNSVVE